MREHACQLGPHQQLAGIVTEPSVSARPISCLLINAGLVPKFGPYRIYAQLARSLAYEGFRTLRIDLGGLGDSPLVNSHEPLCERTAREIAIAIDHLQTLGDFEGVIVGGLCSGADDALRHAEHDARVTGVVLVDPFSYSTPSSRRRYLAMRLVGRTLRTLLAYRTRPRAASLGVRDVHLVEYRYMEQPESRRILAALLDRGVHVHFVYTGGMRDKFNHPFQLQQMFPDLDLSKRVTLDHFPRTEHTQVLAEDRAALVEAITRRLTLAGPR